MRNITLLLIILMPVIGFSQKLYNPNNNFPTLVVLRNNYISQYSSGTSMKVVYIKDGKYSSVKGKLETASGNQIQVLAFNRSSNAAAINVDSIFSVKKLKRKTRLIAGIVYVVSGLAAAIIGNGNNNLSSALAITAAIPAVGAFYTFLGSYVFQEVEKRSIKNGWIFKVQ